MKLAKNQVAHIDNNFYKITARMAVELAGRLPRCGYEIKVPAEKLAGLEFGKLQASHLGGSDFQFVPFPGVVSEKAQGWIKRTPLSWFAGRAVKSRSVWALHVWQPIS